MPDKPHETSIRALLALPFTLLLPLALVSLYRLIPPAARGLLFPGPSTSHLALEEMLRTRRGWAAVRRHAQIKW